MSDYKCENCGMGVSGMNCAKCDTPLVHDHITKDDGSTVAISMCPEGHGKIKSPMCCGNDMACSTN
ncbi:MAG: hypothetical protein VX731_02250 [Candidatus Neomarinimicrobiota bacterium]|jgi:hypothetical protein|nr:hypothetical protein [Candidatus Neomarinimicrobiota bacterium]MEC9006926.1 hypothetical protein [Candidatus Neomarinimicrobiota bacterium]|tara:strand:+ start:229 stop:426 length:198 start_codon:yes stop_codon:yes gene_type:complete